MWSIKYEIFLLIFTFHVQHLDMNRLEAVPGVNLRFELKSLSER